MPSSRLAYLLLLGFVFAIPWEEAIVLPGLGSVARVIGLAAFALALFGLVRGGRIRVRRPSLLLVAAVPFVAWSVASTFWSIDTEVTTSSAFTLVQLLVMVWLVWQLAPTTGRQRGLAQSFVLGCYVTALNIVWIFLFQGDAINIDNRVTALGANQNDIASLMALGIPFAWQLLRRGRGPAFWLNLLYLPTALTAIVLTGSRGGTITAAVALLVVPLSYFQLRPRLQLLLLSALLSIGAAILVVPNRVIDRATPNFIRLASIPEDLSAGNLTGRLVIWRGGFEALQQRPVVGFGAGTFREAVRPILGKGYAPHNGFLSVAVGTGLVGLALFGLVFLSVTAPIGSGHGNRDPLPSILLLALIISLLPLGWDAHKATWFILAYLSVQQVLAQGTGATVKVRVPRAGAIAVSGGD